MKKRYIVLTILLLFIYQSFAPVQCFAFETRRVVLIGPVDTARYHSQEINKIIEDNWKRVFRYPFYEVTAEIHDFADRTDRSALERVVIDHAADIVIVTEIVRLRDFTYSRGFWDDETWQEIDLQLAVRTYEKSGGRYQAFTVRRWQNEPFSIYSGAVPLISDAMDEVLAKVPFKRVPQEL